MIFLNSLATTLDSLVRLAIHPLGDIIHSKDNIVVAPREWERSHEVNAPSIDNSTFKNEVERHIILLRRLSFPLAMITRVDIVVNVLE